MGECKNWIGDKFFDGDRETESVSTKPLLATCHLEAFKIAMVDSILDITDERRVEIYRDVYKVTEEEWQSIDPMALCRNIFNRFVGTGGYMVRGVYAANASPREVFDACIGNSEQNDTDRFIADMKGSLGDAQP